MIERIIEFSIRNRFLVLFLAAALAVGGIYAVLNTPVDAIPDLSENQVIVFTDWMGRSPEEIEDQVTYPLSLKLQGLAGIKAVRSSSEFNFSMITIIFEDNIDFYFARAARDRKSWARPPTSCRRAWCPTWPPTPRPWDRSSGTRWRPARRIRSTRPAVGPEQVLHRARTERGLRRGRRGHRRRHCRWNTRSTCGPKPCGLRHHAGRSLLGRGQEQHAGGRRRDAEEQRRVHRPRRRLDQGQGETSKTRSSKRSTARPIYVKNVATVQLGTQFRRSVFEKDGNEVIGGVVLMRHGENPLAVTQRIKDKIQELQPGLPTGVHIVPAYDRTRLITAPSTR